MARTQRAWARASRMPLSTTMTGGASELVDSAPACAGASQIAPPPQQVRQKKYIQRGIVDNRESEMIMVRYRCLFDPTGVDTVTLARKKHRHQSVDTEPDYCATDQNGFIRSHNIAHTWSVLPSRPGMRGGDAVVKWPDERPASGGGGPIIGDGVLAAAWGAAGGGGIGAGAGPALGVAWMPASEPRRPTRDAADEAAAAARLEAEGAEGRRAGESAPDVTEARPAK